MASKAETPPESALRAFLAQAKQLRTEARSDPQSAADRLAVRTYQQLRMASTHAALLSSERYAPAARFFLTELYSTSDLAQRDADIERVIRLLIKFLPDKALQTLVKALEMDALSETLDAHLAAVARTHQADQRPLKLNPATYAAAYQRMGEFKNRERQIALTRDIGVALDKLSRTPMLRTLLAVMRGPAVAGGVGELHRFLEHGYDAFAHMKGGSEFIEGIVERELQEHRRLAAAE